MLRNLLGIKSTREMERVEERELTRAAAWALRSYENDRCISAGDLCDLHRSIEIATLDALVEHRREEYFAAVRAGLDRNYSPMRKLFSVMIDGEEA